PARDRRAGAGAGLTRCIPSARAGTGAAADGPWPRGNRRRLSLRAEQRHAEQRARLPGSPSINAMRKIDIFNHIYPPTYYARLMQVAPNYKDIGKRMRNIP